MTSIIILNWNRWEDTLKCLDSLHCIDYPTYEVILIDNGSTDDSVARIIDYMKRKSNSGVDLPHGSCPKDSTEILEIVWDNGEYHGDEKLTIDWRNSYAKRLVIVRVAENMGFTGGNNIGMNLSMKALKPEFMLLLNNDTIVDKNFLRELVLAGIKKADAAFLSPKILFRWNERNSDVVQYAGARQSLWTGNSRHIGFMEHDEGQYNVMQETDYAHGSCILARTEAVSSIGLLDDDFFCYREENDWCTRGKRLGWCSLYVPNAVIWHKGGASDGSESSTLTIYYKTRNDFIFMKKNASVAQYSSFLLISIGFRFWFQSLVYLMLHRNYPRLRAHVLGFRDGMEWKSPTK